MRVETSRVEKAVLGMGVAVIALVSLVLGLVIGAGTGATKAELQRELDAARHETTAALADATRLEDDLRETEADNEQLRSELGALREQLGNAVPGGDPQPPDEVGQEDLPTDGPVRRQGDVTLAERGDRIDLNAPEGRTWVYDSLLPSLDLASLEDGQLRLLGVSSLRLEDVPASYEACSTSTGYADVYEVSISSLDANTCFRLNSGRFARLVATRMQPDRVVLNVTIWEEA